MNSVKITALLCACLMVGTLSGCKKSVPSDPTDVTPSSQSNVTISEIESDASSNASSPQSKSTSQPAKPNVTIPNAPSDAVDTVKVSVKETVASTAEFAGRAFPVFENWTVYPTSENGLEIGNSAGTYRVNTTQKYEVNSSLFGMYYGSANNYGKLITAVISDSVAVSLVWHTVEDIPVITGHIYHRTADDAVLVTVSDYNLLEDEMWVRCWDILKGMGVDLPTTATYKTFTGKQAAQGTPKLVWEPQTNHPEPKMNTSIREDLSTSTPSDWKLIEANSVITATSPDGLVVLTVEKYNSTQSLNAEFMGFISGYVNNSIPVRRLKSYEIANGQGEAIYVDKTVYLLKLFSTGEVVYRCNVAFKPEYCTDLHLWLADLVYNKLVFTGEQVVPSTSATESTPEELPTEDLFERVD